MSEPLTPPPDPPVDPACAVPPAAPLAPELLGTTPHLSTAQPLAVPPETLAVIELIGRGLAPDADEYTRATARELWARFAQMIVMAPGAFAVPGTPAAPAAPAAPVMAPMPTIAPVPAQHPPMHGVPMMQPASAPMPGAPMMQPAPAPFAQPAPMYGAPMIQSAPIIPGAPTMQPIAMPMLPQPPQLTSPAAIAARAMRQMSPDQLLDVVLGRLRAKLPPGANVAAPAGIQFQLVPVTPPQGSR